MSRVLVTGASGFVGCRLCPALASRGHEVSASIRVGDERQPKGAAHLYPLTVGPDADWSAALEGQEAVVHLAARAHVMRETEPDPGTAYHQVNVEGTLRLAQAAASSDVNRFVFLSTVKVHGEATTGAPFTESDPAAPQDAYARSKWEAEQGLRTLSEATGLEVVILRPPLVYGPGVKGNFLALLRLCASGMPLPFARVQNRRSLLFVDNLVDAVCAALECPQAAGQTYLVRDGQDLSTPELCRHLSAGLGRSGRLWPIPVSFVRTLGWLTDRKPAVDRLVRSLTIDDSRIRRELDWGPSVDVRTALQATARWYLEMNEQPLPSNERVHV